MVSRFASALVLSLALALAAPAARADSHIDRSTGFLQGLADRAVAVISDETLSDEQRHQEFLALFRKGFAVKGIGRFVVGRYWRSASDAERNEYLELFGDYVAATWSDRLFANYKGQPFEITGARDDTPAKSAEAVAVVESRILVGPSAAVGVEWRIASKGAVIKITDVKVEGISLATTQRDEWVSLINKHGRKLSVLIERLREQRGRS